MFTTLSSEKVVASKPKSLATTDSQSLPVVDTTNEDSEVGDYNPFEHRNVPHPTTDLETIIHLMKGSLGTGILAMPDAFRNAGLFFGLFATVFVGIVCAYSIYILVKCAHKLCRKMEIPSLGFSDVAKVAFLAGPPKTRKFATLAKFMVDLFLVLDLVGCCCVYVVFVAKNAKQVMDGVLDKDIDLRVYMVALLPFLIAMNLISHLKYLAPLSLVADVLLTAGMCITFYYIFQELPSPMTRPGFSSIAQLPIFFGTAIFALEGIGVVMPLENNMKTPTHFISCPGVLNIGMTFVVLLYSSVGFFGYLKYGEATKASITLNLPYSILAQSVKVMIAVSIFLTYSLQFYVPFGIIWRELKDRFTNHPALAESIARILLVILTVVIAVLVPQLGPFLSLVGALCLSFLGLLFPAIVEIVTYWDSEEGLGPCNWVLWKGLAIIMFGIVGLFTGSYTSILAIIDSKGS